MASLLCPFTRSKPELSLYPRIEIGADSSRVGKTTAVRVIAQAFRKKGMAVKMVLEDWKHNPHLSTSYANPQEGLRLSQEWFITRKYEQLKERIGFPGGVIQDVNPEMDFCYAYTNLKLGRLGRADFDRYAQLVSRLDWKRVCYPDLLVYLTVSDEEFLKRLRRVIRDFEAGAEEYFLALKEANRRFVLEAETQGLVKVLRIDTDVLDYSRPGVDREAFIAKVMAALSTNATIEQDETPLASFN